MVISIAFDFREVPFCGLEQVRDIEDEYHNAKEEFLWLLFQWPAVSFFERVPLIYTW